MVKYIFCSCTIIRNWFSSLFQTLNYLGVCSIKIIGIGSFVYEIDQFEVPLHQPIESSYSGYHHVQ